MSGFVHSSGGDEADIDPSCSKSKKWLETESLERTNVIAISHAVNRKRTSAA